MEAKLKTSFMIDTDLNEKLTEAAEKLGLTANQLQVQVLRIFFAKQKNRNIISDQRVSYQGYTGNYLRKSIYYLPEDYAFMIKARCHFRMSASLIIFIALRWYLDAAFRLWRSKKVPSCARFSPRSNSYSIWRWTGDWEPMTTGRIHINLKEFRQTRIV